MLISKEKIVDYVSHLGRLETEARQGQGNILAALTRQAGQEV